MYEVLEYYRPKILRSDALQRLNLIRREYFVVSSHREENVDLPERFGRLVDLLNGLGSKYHKRIIVSTHPRMRKRIAGEVLALCPEIEFVAPMGLCDYVYLQMNARATLSDSGTITEESSILNFPALNIRDAHERPEGMEEGSVMLTGFNLGRVLEALSVLDNQGRDTERTLRVPTDYSVPNVSEKIVRIIMSYTDYVNRTVWHRY